jgi:hypothetical protein
VADDRGGAHDGGGGYWSGHDRSGHDGYGDRRYGDRGDHGRDGRGHDGEHGDGHRYDRDRDGYDRDRHHRHAGDSRKRHWDRSGWDKPGWGKPGWDKPGQRNGDRQDGRRAEQKDKSRVGHKYGHEVAFTHQQQSMLAHLTRAEAFLDALSGRIADSDLDPGLKSTLLNLIAERRATVVDLITQVQAASSLQDLREIRPEAFNPMGGTGAPTS